MDSISDRQVTSLQLAIPCFQQACAVNHVISANRSCRTEVERQNSELSTPGPVILNQIEQLNNQENGRYSSLGDTNRVLIIKKKNYLGNVIEVRDEILEQSEEAENSRILAKLLNEIDSKMCTCITARLFPHWAISCGGQKNFTMSSGLSTVAPSAVALAQTRIEKNVLGQDSISIDGGHYDNSAYGYNERGRNFGISTKKVASVMQAELGCVQGMQDSCKIIRQAPTDSNGRITFIELQSKVTTEMSKLKMEETTFDTRWPVTSQITALNSSHCTDTVSSSSSKPDRYIVQYLFSPSIFSSLPFLFIVVSYLRSVSHLICKL